NCPVVPHRVVVGAGRLGAAVWDGDGRGRGRGGGSAPEHGGGVWAVAGGEGARGGARAALVPDGAVGAAGRAAGGGQGAGVGADRAGGCGGEAGGAGGGGAGVRRPAHRAALVAAPRGAEDRGGLSEAGRRRGAVAGDPRAPRPRREQIPGLAEDRPDR